MSSVRPDQIETIRQLNVLDLELYAFAQKLMYQRFERLQKRDSQFHERFAHLGELPGRQSEAFNWDQVIDADDNSSMAPHK
jgi:heparan sulfate 6-O-sulfotransferase HS6ST1